MHRKHLILGIIRLYKYACFLVVICKETDSLGKIAEGERQYPTCGCWQ